MSETQSGAPIPPNQYPGQYASVPGPAQPMTAPQPPAPQPVQPAKKSKGPIIALIVAVVCLLGIGGFVASCTATLNALSSGGRGSAFGANVGTIHLDGTIGEGLCTPENFGSMLDAAEKDDSIKAVVIRVESGGGVAAAGEEMAVYLKDFSKPVVVSSGSINASAAYEISSQADYIYCNKSTEVGSIGTAMQTLDYSGLLKMLGITATNITSSDSKDSSYGTRPLTDEEIAYYQQIVDEINENFIETVAEGRDMSVEDVRKLATGMVFTGEQGVDNGLVDEIGTMRDALDKAAELGGISGDYGIIELDHNSDLSSLMYLFGSSDAREQLSELLKQELTSESAPADINQ